MSYILSKREPSSSELLERLDDQLLLFACFVFITLKQFKFFFFLFLRDKDSKSFTKSKIFIIPRILRNKNNSHKDLYHQQTASLLCSCKTCIEIQALAGQAWATLAILGKFFSLPFLFFQHANLYKNTNKSKDRRNLHCSHEQKQRGMIIYSTTHIQ